MARYLLKFSKENNLKYISHLDLLRLFLRAFKRAKLRLRYSQGYNPHAKVGFAHPLSLGFESAAEYLEFETEEEYDTKDSVDRLAAQMPEGLGILACNRLSDTGKTAVAAALEYATYMIGFRKDEESQKKIAENIQGFLRQESIISVKYSKKKRKDVESDIRPFIHSITTVDDKETLKLSTMLVTGSNGNLNPETMAEALCRFAGVEYARPEWIFKRTEMYFTDKKRNMTPLSEFKG